MSFWTGKSKGFSVLNRNLKTSEALGQVDRAIHFEIFNSFKEFELKKVNPRPIENFA